MNKEKLIEKMREAIMNSIWIDHVGDIAGVESAAGICAEAALKELDNEWVRVEDRLPENKRISDKEVELQLVIACSGLQGMDTYVCTGGKWYYGKDLDIEVDDITHWCNLPSPPKDK